MKTLTTGLIIAGVSIFLVNFILFGFFRLSVKSLGFGTLLMIQGGVALFAVFLFNITKKKR